MKKQIIIRPEARNELQEAFKWYESQSDGLGLEFLTAAQAAQELIKRHPESHNTVYHKIRRALIQRFPFSLYYVVLDDEIYVLAVFHARRDPKTLKSRFTKHQKRK